MLLLSPRTPKEAATTQAEAKDTETGNKRQRKNTFLSSKASEKSEVIKERLVLHLHFITNSTLGVYQVKQCLL